MLDPTLAAESDAKPPRPTLVKMSTLAQLSGVPAATIKHYLREGLLPQPWVRTSKNMAFYEASLVERIRAIKDLQRKHFLPLKVIKGVLDGTVKDVDGETVAAIERALDQQAPRESRSREQLLDGGMPASLLDAFTALGLITPEGFGETERFTGDDLTLLRTLGASRRAGMTSEMLPPSIVEAYVQAIRELVRTELELFREGVVPRAGKHLPELTEAATKLSEQLVVLVRRKMLVPTLRQIVESEQLSRRAHQRMPSEPPPRRRAPRLGKSRRVSESSQVSQSSQSSNHKEPS